MGEPSSSTQCSWLQPGSRPWRVDLCGCRECQGSFGREGHPGAAPGALAVIPEHRVRPVSRARLADEADPGSPRAGVDPWCLEVVETENVCPTGPCGSAITDRTSCLLRKRAETTNQHLVGIESVYCRRGAVWDLGMEGVCMDRELFGPTQLVTQAEAAGILRMDQATVIRLADTGKIWSVRLMGGERRYRGTELRRFGAFAIPRQRRG